MFGLQWKRNRAKLTETIIVQHYCLYVKLVIQILQGLTLILIKFHLKFIIGRNLLLSLGAIFLLSLVCLIGIILLTSPLYFLRRDSIIILHSLSWYVKINLYQIPIVWHNNNNLKLHQMFFPGDLSNETFTCRRSKKSAITSCHAHNTSQPGAYSNVISPMIL